MEWFTHGQLASCVLATWMSATGCSSPATATSPGRAAAPDGETVTASNDLAWEQVSFEAPDTDGYEYVFFIDGQRSEPQRAKCVPTAPETYSCSTRAPTMSPGRHVLQIALVHRATGAESDRSSPLVVVMSSAGRVAILP